VLGVTATYLVFAAAAQARPDELGGRLRVGYIDADSVYICKFDGGNGATDWIRLEKWRLPGRIPAGYRMAIGSYRDADTQLRWHIAHNCFWVIGQEAARITDPALRVPLAHLSIYDPNNPERKDAKKQEAMSDLSFTHEWQVYPVSEFAASIHVNRMEGGSVRLRKNEVCYDLLPTAQDSCLLFVLNESRMTTFKGKGEEAPKGATGYVVRYEEMDRFNVGFQEPFLVFGDRDTYVFVTHSGRVYLSKPGGQRRSAEPISKDDARRVVAVIGDVANGATYLLARAAPGHLAMSKCLRLDKEGRLTQWVIDPAKLKPVPSDEDNPLDVCLPFARYLLSEGKLTDKRP
jgi:hypothetical protein